MQSDLWVVRIGTEPRDPDSNELLELVMAGASLEVPLLVIFSGAGRGHLCGTWSDRWRQLIDFDLAELVYQVDEGASFEPDIAVGGLDAAKIDCKCSQARGVLDL